MFGIKINNIDFYGNPTINYLKNIIAHKKNINNEKSLIANRKEITVNLTKNQLRFKEQYNLNLSATNMNIVFQHEIVVGNMDQFISDFHALIVNNRIFNCKINNYLKIHYSSSFKPRIELVICQQVDDSELEKYVSVENKYKFNLFEETPIRVKFWQTQDKVIFIINVHHLFFDGASMFSLKNAISELALGKRYIAKDKDFLDYCLKEELHLNSTNVTNDIMKNFIRYIGNCRVFSLSEQTNKNKGSLAQGYQLTIYKNLIASEPCNINMGISKLLLAFQKTIYSIFNKSQFTCQIPISTNQIGDYIGVFGYFISIIIFRNNLNINEDYSKQLDGVEQSLRTAQSFLGANLIGMSDKSARFDYSSILFNYIPTNETLDLPENYFSYEKEFYREMLVFVYENKDCLCLKIVFNKQVFSTRMMKEFCQQFAERIKELLFI